MYRVYIWYEVFFFRSKYKIEINSLSMVSSPSTRANPVPFSMSYAMDADTVERIREMIVLYPDLVHPSMSSFLEQPRTDIEILMQIRYCRLNYTSSINSRDSTVLAKGASSVILGLSMVVSSAFILMHPQYSEKFIAVLSATEDIIRSVPQFVDTIQFSRNKFSIGN